MGIVALALGLWLGFSRGAMLERSLLHDVAPGGERGAPNTQPASGLSAAPTATVEFGAAE